MTQVEQLAHFVARASYDDLSLQARQELKIRVLDSFGCALGALDGEPIQKIREHLADFGGRPFVTLIGGEKSSPDRAAFYNAALVRYLDYNDSFLAPGETCHPSDNLGAVLAASEYANASGKDLLTALAVAYQVQGRLSEEAPVRAKGFDHTTQGAYAATAGAARALGLSPEQTAHALAISGTANNALRVTRTGKLSNWKGLASPHTSFTATHAAFLAMRGITGPLEVFEGNKGFIDTISGPFTINWHQEDLELVRRTILKRFNAEIHSQSALEGLLELKASANLQADQIERIEVAIFDVSYNIIGGGEEGDKRLVQTKEEADHSLPYMLAVALLDGKVTPEQYTPERINRPDVQALLRRVFIRPDATLSARFPHEMPCRIHVYRNDGEIFSIEKTDYQGFYTRPMTWQQAKEKFFWLAADHASEQLREEIADAVQNLDIISVRQLTDILAQVRKEGSLYE
ncbi:2-methylcitrate dehydratase [Thermosporothrix hazakensis]|jgi:2-methylcitrate dehydratase|uniref:2-methylcitrate dehydratase n=2 Tax=Thermosporothrix TaxID=768650 RepID=A0A326U352_THEHA|nr:MmgE/PrpD family protein [Thermosporothrix hazakensis]PZW25396.1 2-methylcitrate dehydratase [Thermosporothrix hazakensis]BBH90730.1 2-methylcitrate dehydratase [Thermosporothrix sp. COM3]GCE48780.1 2-methylcitrate dehydratase [Thermosporothrix hazakensis]